MIRSLAAALALAGTLVLTTPVTADATATCVGQSEYQQVEYDMRKVRVTEIFDGYLGFISYYSTLGGNEYDERHYNACWTTKDVVIMYVNTTTSPYWRVQWKALQ